MNQPAVFDPDIRALQQWLRDAWQQLGDPALTAFSRRELRNQMKQRSADLRAQLQRIAEQPPSRGNSAPVFIKPELRILA